MFIMHICDAFIQWVEVIRVNNRVSEWESACVGGDHKAGDREGETTRDRGERRKRRGRAREGEGEWQGNGEI